RAEHAQVVAALDDGVVVGGVTYVPDGGPMADLARDGEAEIRMLGVAPDAQGRGAGTALVRECLERAAGRSVVLSTNAVARTSHRLYERLGIVREPARDWVPVPDVTLLCYVRWRLRPVAPRRTAHEAGRDRDAEEQQRAADGLGHVRHLAEREPRPRHAEDRDEHRERRDRARPVPGQHR